MALDDGVSENLKVLHLGEWDGTSGRALFWSADFGCLCTYALTNPALCFDRSKVNFERIKPEILCSDEVVGKILVFRIKVTGCTCIIESERITQCMLPGGYRNPKVDNPHITLWHYYYRSHMEGNIEIIDNLMIRKDFFDTYEEPQ